VMLRFEMLGDAAWSAIVEELPDKTRAQAVRASINKAVFTYVADRPSDAAGDHSEARQRLIDSAEAFKSRYFEVFNNEALVAVVEEDAAFLARLDEIIADSQQAAGVLRYYAPPRKKRGSNPDIHLTTLINKLITIGEYSGLNVSASSSNGRGGPMVRFLQKSMQHVLGGEPSADAVRGWIRKFVKTRGDQ
jgi:hypothetical protein